MDHTFKLIFTTVGVLLGILHRRYETQDRMKSFPLKNVEETFPFIQEYDYIIVGGGASGSILANKLSEKNTVLLLEYGGNPLLPTSVPAFFPIYHNANETSHVWYSVKQKSASLKVNGGISQLPQGKGLGGSTLINVMFYNRGNPKDYENWATIVNDKSWSYDSLLPYFKMTENFHEEKNKYDQLGSNGPLFISKHESMFNEREAELYEKFKEAGKEMGFNFINNFNAPQEEGFGTISYAKKNGRRFSAYSAFIEPILDRKTLTISRYSEAKKIDFDETMTAQGVFYLHHGVEKFAKAKKEVILSAGAMNSPLILMRSGIGPENQLKAAGIEVKANLPVGENIQDHPLVYFHYFYLNEDIYSDGQSEINEFIKNGKGHFSNILGIVGQAFIVSEEAKKVGEENWPDIQLVLGFFSKNAVFSDNSLSVLMGVNRPTSRGSLKLNTEDPMNNPLIFDPAYLTTERDIKVFIEANKIGQKLLETKAINSLGGNYVKQECDGKEFGSDEYYECLLRATTGTYFHPVGTCKMGKDDDSTSVVDSQLRVKGVKNLRVVDNSIMPQITNANTMAVAYGEIYTLWK